MKKLFSFALLALLVSSAYGQSAFNYVIYNVNGSVNALVPNWFGNVTQGTPAIFMHDPTGFPVLANLDSTLVYDPVSQTVGVLLAARSFSYPTRSLNTAFQPSTSRDCFVSYSVDIACTLSLTTGQSGSVILEYADDSGITTNVKTVQSTANANTGTLAIGLALTQTATASLTGIIPTGKYVRLRTVNTTGTPTFTYRGSQEVLE